jgi:DNA-binding NarL/FixJ family response regulator
MEELVRVAILAPTLAVRVGLRTLLNASDLIEVVAEIPDPQEDVNGFENADVVILQDDSPSEVWQSLTKGESQLALLWLVDDPQAAQILRRLPLRSWGIVSTETSDDELVAACIAVNQGLIVAPARYLESTFGNVSLSNSNTLIESLTPREEEVLQLLAQGLANKQIALLLDISKHTVKFHISSIYGKFGATNRTEAVRLGLQFGLIAL